MNTLPNPFPRVQDSLESHSNPPTSFGIKSTNVMLETYDEPVEAVILVQNQKVFDIIIPDETDPATLAQIHQDWVIHDYGELVIFPGLIDSNVHLHADFSEDWENIELSTELAAAGGVTTIIDNPSLSAPYNSGEEYVEVLKKRIEKIKEKSLVDFGVFGVLEPRTQDNITEILQAGALGLKAYLASTPQNTILHYGKEEFEDVFEEIEERHPEILLLIHPEMTTDRELYLTSPCRTQPASTRLDMLYNIKSIEFGGAANKGSYIDDFNKKYRQDDDEEDSEEEGETKENANKGDLADIDSPKRFQEKILQVRERTEINDLVYQELNSYTFDAQENVNDGDSTPDSDNEFMEKGSQESGKQKFSTLTEMIEKQEQNEASKTKLSLNSSYDDSDEKEISREITFRKLKDIGKNNSEKKLNATPVRKSIFAKSRPEEKKFRDYVREKIQQFESLEVQKYQDHPESQNEVKEAHEEKKEEENFVSEVPALGSKQCSLDVLKEEEDNEQKNNLNLLPGLLNKVMETKTCQTCPEFDSKGEKNTTDTQEDTTEPLRLVNRRPLSPIKTFPPLVTSWNNDNLDTRASLEGQESIDTKARRFEYKELAISLEQSPMTPYQDESPNNMKIPTFLPKVGTPANSSSLLQRRITLKSLNQVMTPVESAATTPLGKLSRFSSLEVMKTPESIEKREAKHNQNYRTFLANRPLSWEENAVSLIIENVKPETRMRIVIQNLSLASSFMKIEMKKSEGNLQQRIFSDVSPAYLYFSDKMVKKGETKYKVSPPLRNKENRRLLLEHFRVGAIDLMSSYHFYVPQEYKQIDNGNFRRAFGGLNTMGCSLQSSWTALYNSYQKNDIKFQDESPFRKHKINFILRQIYKKMCVNPARLLKVEHIKGEIAKGKDADFVIWDPYQYDNGRQLNKENLFEGKTLMGTVFKTYLRGNVIYDKNDATPVKRGNVAEFIRSSI